MKNVELIFKSADFSRETDFKNRLRTQLFDDYMKPSLVQNSFSVKKGSGRSGRFARELSVDELELVTAAGDIAVQSSSEVTGELRKKNGNPLSVEIRKEPAGPLASKNIGNHRKPVSRNAKSADGFLMFRRIFKII